MRKRYFKGKCFLMWAWGSIVKPRKLTTLGKDLSSNEFSGTIPASIGDLEHLLTLNLTRNQLNGHLSAEFGNLRSIQIVEANTDEVFAQMTSLAESNV
ncbi:hypothetical protein GIB67_019985 [Kingdonia uniflora]|uniref:Uncharacterized protein n=1 Tax=Kingdonia uniflora TaxID=39325 RepID=A0A7J7MKM8_9MAGN|nr:hypothetical protein GIB67_019985 [Kingdonia uniflora]